MSAIRARLPSWLLGAVLLGLCAALGAVIALAMSPRSLNASVAGGSGANAVSVSPAAASQSPTIPGLAKPGSIGDRPNLVAYKSALVAAGTVQETVSTDGGKTWRQLQAPPGGSGVLVDPSDANHLLSGGADVRTSSDGGKTWSPSKGAPPAPGPYVPIFIAPTDGSVWFFAHQGRLARTRDGGLSWKDVTPIPVLGPNAFMTPLVNSDKYLLATGNRLFEVDSAGAVAEQPSLLSGLEFVAVAATQGTPILARASDGKVYLLQAPAWNAASAAQSGPIASAGNGRLWVGNGGASLSKPAAVAYSADGGQTWAEGKGLPAGETVEALAAVPDGSTVFAYCYGGDLYASSDGGRTWSLLSSALRAA